MATLYYVVKKELSDNNGVQECTGFKTISMYDANDNKIVLLATIDDVRNEENSIDTMKNHFTGHGLGIEGVLFEEL